MRTRPFAREPRTRKREVDEAGNIVAGVARLLSLGNYDRNALTLDEIDRIRDLIDIHGAPTASEMVGCSQLILYKTCSGFAHRLMPETAQQIRKYLGRKK